MASNQPMSDICPAVGAPSGECPPRFSSANSVGKCERQPSIISQRRMPPIPQASRSKSIMVGSCAVSAKMTTRHGAQITRPVYVTSKRKVQAEAAEGFMSKETLAFMRRHKLLEFLSEIVDEMEGPFSTPDPTLAPIAKYIIANTLYRLQSPTAKDFELLRAASWTLLDLSDRARVVGELHEGKLPSVFATVDPSIWQRERKRLETSGKKPVNAVAARLSLAVPSAFSDKKKRVRRKPAPKDV